MSKSSDEAAAAIIIVPILTVIIATQLILTYINVYVFISILMVISFLLLEKGMKNQDTKPPEITEIMGKHYSSVIDRFGQPHDIARTISENNAVVIFKYGKIRGGDIPAYRQKITITNDFVTEVSELGKDHGDSGCFNPGPGCYGLMLAFFAFFCVFPINEMINNTPERQEEKRKANRREIERRSRTVKIKVGSHVEKKVISRKQISKRITFAPDGSIIDEPVYFEEKADVEVDEYKEFTVGELEDAGWTLTDGTWKPKEENKQ